MGRKTAFRNIWGVLSPLLLYFVLETVLYLIFALGIPAFASREGGMWLVMTTHLFLFPVFFYLYKKETREAKDISSFRKGDLILVVLGAVFFSRGLNAFISLTPLPFLSPKYQEVEEIIYGSSLLSQILASAVTAPFLEETLMRGVIYNRIKRYTGSVRFAIIGSALIFGIFHGNIVQGVYAFLLGLFFADLYESYHSLIPPVAAHMAANLASLLMGFMPSFEWISENLAYYCLFMAVCLFLGWFLWKKIKISAEKNRGLLS